MPNDIPEKYELKAPSGATFTDADITAFADEAKEYQLTQDQAQRMVEGRFKRTPKVPEKYDLKVPGGGTFTAADLETLGKEARELGLTNDAAQRYIDVRAKHVTRPPEKYELKAPDDQAFTDADLADVADEAKALGLSQARAQQLLDSRVATAKQVRDKFLADFKADKEIGGTNFDANVAFATKGLEHLWPQGSAGGAFVRGWLNRYGLGNHPEVARGLVKLGRELADDAGAAGGGAGGGGGKKSAAQVLYGG